MPSTFATRPRQPALRTSKLLRETVWLLLIAVGLYLALTLFTYHRDDPGWSQSGTTLTVKNRGGEFGAWLADLLLSLFGDRR